MRGQSPCTNAVAVSTKRAALGPNTGPSPKTIKVSLWSYRGKPAWTARHGLSQPLPASDS